MPIYHSTQGGGPGPVPSAPFDPSTDSTLEAALATLDAGYWPVAIHPVGTTCPSVRDVGKQPIGAGWGAVRPTPGKLRATWRDYHASYGLDPAVGLLCGLGRNLVDLDVDNPTAAQTTLDRMFGPDGPPPTRGWQSSPGRYHLGFAWDDRLAELPKGVYSGKHSSAFAGLEVRVGATRNRPDRMIQSVIPPSTFARDGQQDQRQWFGPPVLAELPDQAIVYILEHSRPLSKIHQPRNQPALVADPEHAMRLIQLVLECGYLDDRLDDYHDWLGVGFALSSLGEAGLQLWDDWSARLPAKYEPGVCQAKWDGFDVGGPGHLGLGSLFCWAMDRGWKPVDGALCNDQDRPSSAPPAISMHPETLRRSLWHARSLLGAKHAVERIRQGLRSYARRAEARAIWAMWNLLRPGSDRPTAEGRRLRQDLADRLWNRPLPVGPTWGLAWISRVGKVAEADPGGFAACFGTPVNLDDLTNAEQLFWGPVARAGGEVAR